jgi:reactive intermediate/imine deaminase
MSLVALLALAAASAAAPQRPLVERFAAPDAGVTKLPFSQAVRLGDTLYLSGMLGVQPGTRTVVPGGIQAETKQTLENIKRALEARGASMDRVVKCTVFLADMAEWPKMNEVYVTFFGDALPARSALGASGLALGARVEIECIAAAP